VLGWRPQITVSQGYDRILAWLHENEKELRELYVS